MTWSEYEVEVLEYLRSKFESATITRDVKLMGKLSNVPRQLDIVIDSQIADLHIRVAVECKNWKTKLNVRHVGEFIDKLRDAGLSRGLVIARRGFSEAAYQRAISETDLQLHILDFESMPENLGFWANTYSGDVAALISAPTGWVVDSAVSAEQLEHFGPCLIYPSGNTIESAMKIPEIMYLRIIPEPADIDELIDKQNEDVRRRDPKGEIQMWSEELNGRPHTFRGIYYERNNYIEYSAFLSSNKFYAYAVVASANSNAEKNLARLRYVMTNAIFVILRGIDPEDSHAAWKAFFRGSPYQILDVY